VVDDATGGRQTSSGVSCQGVTLGQGKNAHTSNFEHAQHISFDMANISENVESVKLQSPSVIQSYSVLSEDQKLLPSRLPYVHGQVQGQPFQGQPVQNQGRVQGHIIGGEGHVQGDVLSLGQVQGTEVQGHILGNETQVIVVPDNLSQNQLQSYAITQSVQDQEPHVVKAMNLKKIQAPVLDRNQEVNILTSATLAQARNQTMDTSVQAENFFHYQNVPVPDRPSSEPIGVHSTNKQMSVIHVPDGTLKMWDLPQTTVQVVRNKEIDNSVRVAFKTSDHLLGKVDTGVKLRQNLGCVKEMHSQIPVEKHLQYSMGGQLAVVDVPQDLSSNHIADGHLARQTGGYQTLLTQNTQPPMSNNQIHKYQ
jgi:hypothetical protein